MPLAKKKLAADPVQQSAQLESWGVPPNRRTRKNPAGAARKKAPATAAPAAPEATEPPTDVIFRIFTGKDGGDVIAIFPGEPGTYSPYTCESYQHVGQHGACNPYALMAQGTRPATPFEYAPLLQELQAIGYNLRIVKRHTQKHRAERVRLLART